MANKTSNTRAGRPAMEGKTRRYIVADDVHEWILAHGGGKYITDTMRTIMAVQQDNRQYNNNNNILDTLQDMKRIEDFDANRKRNYPQVGERTLREDCEDNTEMESKGVGVKSVLAGVMAVLMAVTTGVVILALAGAAALFMPMLCGLTKE